VWGYNSTPSTRLHGVVLSKSTGTILPLAFIIIITPYFMGLKTQKLGRMRACDILQNIFEKTAMFRAYRCNSASFLHYGFNQWFDRCLWDEVYTYIWSEMQTMP
jgi:hypothetical protein